MLLVNFYNAGFLTRDRGIGFWKRFGKKKAFIVLSPGDEADDEADDQADEEADEGVQVVRRAVQNGLPVAEKKL
jgi:hypothetical protein